MPSSQSLRLSSPIRLPAASLPCWNSSFDQIQTRNPRPSRRFQHCSFHRIGRLELLRELVPTATRVAVLVNRANAANAETTSREAGAAARAIGLQIQVVNASTSREVNAAFETS